MEDLRKTFPDFDPAKPLDEDEIKSPQGKEKWRNFMMAYSKKVDDYNFGTIVRTRADGEYTNEGTIFGMRAYTQYPKKRRLTDGTVPRMQFYAIEIARCASSPLFNQVNKYTDCILGTAPDSTTGFTKRRSRRNEGRNFFERIYHPQGAPAVTAKFPRDKAAPSSSGTTRGTVSQWSSGLMLVLAITERWDVVSGGSSQVCGC